AGGGGGDVAAQARRDVARGLLLGSVVLARIDGLERPVRHRDRDAASSEETHVEAVAVLGEQEVGIVMDHFLDLSVAMPDRVETGVRAAEGERGGLAGLATGLAGDRCGV